MRDEQGNPVASGGNTVTVSTDAGTLSAVTDHGDGTYSAVLTAPVVVGVATVGFAVDGVAGGATARVDFVAGVAVVGSFTIVASPVSVVADGVSSSVVTVTARDANGNQVCGGGEVVTLSTDAGTLGAVTDHGDGTYSAVLTAPVVVGVATVGFAVDGVAGGATARVDFVAGAADLVTSTIAAAPSTLEAGGAATSTITVTVVDAFAHPLPGRVVTMTSTAGTLSPVTDHGDGTYTATLTAPTRSGTATIGFAADGETSPHTATVDFVDTTPPTPPTILHPTTGQKTGQQPSLSGTAEPGTTVTVRDGNGATICEAVTAVDGNWSCTPDTLLPFGPESVTAIATDSSGNVSPASAVLEFVIGRSLSITVEDAEIAQGGTTVVTGRGFIPGESVTGVLASDPLQLGTRTADDEGTVTFTIAVPVDFATGPHTVTLTGAVSGSVSAPLTVVASTVVGGLPDTRVPSDKGVPSDTGALSDTGAQGVVPAIAIVLLLLGIGTAFVIGRRRRQHS